VPANLDQPVHERDITNRVTTVGWTDHRIIPAIEIEEDKAIWLVIEVELPEGQEQSVGCDDGTRYNPNGALLSLSVNPQWQTFQEITGDRVNWNIRGLISAE
jgi:hypothetical protein